MVNIGHPWGECDKHKRLKWSEFYSHEQCAVECKLKHVIEKCGCKPFWYPGLNVHINRQDKCYIGYKFVIACSSSIIIRKPYNILDLKWAKDELSSFVITRVMGAQRYRPHWTRSQEPIAAKCQEVMSFWCHNPYIKTIETRISFVSYAFIWQLLRRLGIRIMRLKWHSVRKFIMIGPLAAAERLLSL